MKENMDRSLFFIPLIEIALRQPEPVGAMIKAFRKIELLGRQSSHAEGFKMFIAFMAEVNRNWEIQRHMSGKEAPVVIYDLIFQTAAGRFGPDEARIDGENLPEDLLALLELQIQILPVADPRDFPVELDIIRDETIVAIVILDTQPAFHHVSDILPGAYTFTLGSGRVLWEVVLAEKDLLLTKADPGRNLSLAADTGEKHKVRPTREISVLGGEIVFRVFPGLENGRIEIEMRTLR
jgi:hypothetical protein